MDHSTSVFVPISAGNNEIYKLTLTHDDNPKEIHSYFVKSIGHTHEAVVYSQISDTCERVTTPKYMMYNNTTTTWSGNLQLAPAVLDTLKRVCICKLRLNNILVTQDMTIDGLNYNVLDKVSIDNQSLKKVCKLVCDFTELTNVFHNDLKPDNIMVKVLPTDSTILDRDNLSICMFDFDLAAYDKKSFKYYSCLDKK